ncbi:hypothetical protein Tco_0584125 [Tanacetum coccineum]
MIWILEEMDINAKKGKKNAMTAITLKRVYKNSRRPRVDGKMPCAVIKKSSNVSIATILGILTRSASLKVKGRSSWGRARTADEELNQLLMASQH